MRSIHVPARYQRPALVATVTFVVVTVVAGSLAWPRGGPDAPSLSPSPGSAGASPSFEPGAAGWNAVAELSAVETPGPVVPLSASFRLASLGSASAVELAGRLRVDPELAFSVTPDPDGRSARLTPDEPLLPGAVYRFTLSGTTGQELDSWAFQAQQSVRVVGTLPGDEETDVPLDTGIEITFDQDGVTDVASHVTIEPATKGRFEQHGRVTVFVPEELTPATIYTVTVRKGVAVSGTDETMAEDVRFSFETAPASTPSDGEEETTFQFQDDLFESATAEPPVIGLWGFVDDRVVPKTARVEVFRLADLDAAVTAFQQVRSSPRWSRWSTEGQVPTAGLTRVLAIDAKLNTHRNALWLTLPERLAAGWYVVQMPTGTRPAQAILQVTDLAGYLVVSDTRTLVWVNDLAGGDPVADATVSSAGNDLGRTDDSGVLLADTPNGFKPAAAAACEAPGCLPVLTVRDASGRAAMLPGSGQQDKFEPFETSYIWDEAHPRFWVLLNTDRTIYRPTDTINVWGVIRDRDSGLVPATVHVRLDPPTSDTGATKPPVTSLTLRPGPTGAFTGSIALAEVPEGSYHLALSVGKDHVRTIGVQVEPILKPAYRLDVTTGRRVYLNGDQIRITAQANFFEGTPVPGVPLRIDGYVDDEVTTNGAGSATYRMVADIREDSTDGPTYQTIHVSPARAEEGEIAGASRDFVVFPASRMIDAQSSIEGGAVRVTGTVHTVDVERLEREIAEGRWIWELDPRGKPVASSNVSAHFVELIPQRTRTGTEYDFITKKAVPIYSYDTIERDAGTVRVKTNAQGEYAVSVPAATSDHDYYVTLTIGDPDGNRATTTTFASAEVWSDAELRDGGGLLPTDPDSFDPQGFGIGEKIDLTLTDSTTHPATTGGRYLFFTAQRGLRTVSVQASGRFVTTFDASAAPNIDIGGVRFTGTGYSDGGQFRAAFREAERRLDVELSVASARFSPGDDVTVNVVTRNADGAPIAATVVLRAVDEKLFSIGAAAEVDPLGQLYAHVTSGIGAVYRSHRTPRSAPDGVDTTGGGGDDRTDFRDSLLFRAVDTGADGRGTVSFKLSDDLTSWRVSASAISVDLEAGEGSVQVPVGLPFFVDASIAPEYLVADHPTIQVRTYGSALEAGAPVTITVGSTTLTMPADPIEGTAFQTIAIPLPPLRPGTHDLTISATTGSGSSTATDKLTRRFRVVDSRLTRTQTSYAALVPGLRLEGGDGLTTVVLSDAGAARYLPLLESLAGRDGARLDSALAADLAGSLIEQHFDRPDAEELAAAFTSDPYQTADGGLALLPYSSSDLELSALVAIVAPNRVASSRLEAYLNAIWSSADETRERRMLALAGLAGLDEPVLLEIRAAAVDPDLTIHERLMIGLGAAAIGDAATARSVATALSAEFGEGVGSMARLRAGSSASDVTAATALMAALGAAVGDARAPAYWAYVEANPSKDALHVIPAVAYAARSLDRVSTAPASFAYTVDGARKVIDLEAGASFELTLTSAQLGGLSLDPVSGDVGVSVSWREPVAAEAFALDPDVTITRAVAPRGAIGSGDLVRVDLSVKFGPAAAQGCHDVTDLVPSGLVPVGAIAAWIVEGEEPPPPTGYQVPYAQFGQRVSFCAERDPKRPVIALRYYARVVTPGDYTWEPAVVRSQTGPDRAALTPQVEVTIR